MSSNTRGDEPRTIEQRLCKHGNNPEYCINCAHTHYPEEQRPSNPRLTAQELIDGLRNCRLCEGGVISWGSGICPRCGGPDSFERQAADEIERLTAELAYWQKDSAAAWDKCEDRRLSEDRLRAALKEMEMYDPSFVAAALAGAAESELDAQS